MERAAGERVEIHHMHERGRAVDLPGFCRGKAQRGIQDIGIVDAEIAGSTIAHVLFGVITARGGEFLVVAVAVPNGLQQLERTRRGVIVRICRSGCAAGRQREKQHGAENNRNHSFHGWVLLF